MIKSIIKIVRFLRKRPKSLWRAFIDSMFMIVGSSFAPCFPLYIIIEPSAFCNLGCPICETGNKTLERKQGIMILEDFKAIIDKVCFHTNTILLYFMGEPFLNSFIYDMISYARKKEIYTCICTNGENVDARKLIKSGINEISFQISGISQDVHERYRRGADFAKTIENLKKLVEEKKSQEKEDISIEVGFIVMKHNEYQVSEFKKIAMALGADRAHIIKPRVKSIEQAREFLPSDGRYWLYDKILYEKGIFLPSEKKRFSNRCFWLWNSLAITHNGDIVPCCNDPHGHFIMGNILRQELKEIWNNSHYRALRRNFLKERRSFYLCSHCVE